MSARIPSDEVAEDYKSSLEDLIDNSRLVINNLTVIAKENIEHAMAISRVLENHIKITPPNRKLPALYLLDSIVKNVGTPYTLFLGRNLYSTFMNAYTLVTAPIRQKLDEMLQTWKMPNPGSLDTKPVFPPEVTRPMEEALRKARASAFEQQQQQALRSQQEMIARGQSVTPLNGGLAATSTPPQQFNQFAPPQAMNYNPTPQPQPFAPNGQFLQVRAVVSPGLFGATNPRGQQTPLYPLAPQSAPPVAQGQTRVSTSYQSPSTPIDLPQLHRDIEDLIRASQGEAALKPFDTAVRGRLDALLALRAILHQQYHPPEQLQQVRAQVTQLQNTSRPAPTSLPDNVLFNTNATPVQHQSIPPAYPNPPAPQQPPHATGQPPVDLQALMSSQNLADIIAKVQDKSATPPAPVQASVPAPSIQISTPGGSGGDVSDLLASLKRAGMLTGNGQTPSQTPPTATPPVLLNPINKIIAVNDVELTSASLKIPRPQLLSQLYEAQPNQCTTCARRFLATDEGRERKRRHYDWHFRTNQRMNDSTKRAQNRSWYVDELDWIKSRDDPEGDVDAPLEGNAGSEAHGLPVRGAGGGDPKQQWVPVPADPVLANQPCPICQEKFVASYNDEVSDWVWMDAIQVGNRIFHVSCHSEVKKNSSRDVTPARTSTPDSVLGKRKQAEIGSPAAKMIKT